MLQGDGDPEQAPLVRGALQAQLPAHQGDQMFDDGESQAGATVAPRGGAVGLDEGAEQLFLLIGLDADAGVADPEGHRAESVAIGRRDLDIQIDVAGVGKLDGVAQQVEQNLPQPPRVAGQGGGLIRLDEAPGCL